MTRIGKIARIPRFIRAASVAARPIQDTAHSG
jgi:hypothetical protein